MPNKTIATTEGDESEDENQDTQSQEEGNTVTGNQTNKEQQEASELPASEPTPPATAADEPTSPSTCPELPNDGRPQPSKGANTNPHTWKVVPMRDDPRLFKVVDNAGINVADQFQSQSNAEQYVAHFVCGYVILPQPTPQEQEGCLIPEGCIEQLEICDDGIDNDADGIIDEVFLCYSSSPGQIRSEVCGDGIDNNADGFIDEGCPPSQLPQESGPILPDVGAGGAPLPGEQGGGPILPDIIGGPALTGELEGPALQAIDEPEESNILLLPRKCVSYELFKPINPMDDPAVQAMTCAKILKYTDTNQTVAFVEQWFNGNIVYDSAFPKSTNIPCRFCQEEIVGTVGKYQVKVSLELWPDYNRLDLRSATRTDLTSFPYIKEPGFGGGGGKNLFVWQSPTPPP